MIQVSPDFRRARYGEWLSGPGNHMLLVRTCQELVGGRWESFISIEAESLPVVGVLEFRMKEGL